MHFYLLSFQHLLESVMEGVCAKVTTDSALDRPSHRQRIQEHEKCALGGASLYLCNFFRAIVFMSGVFLAFLTFPS